MESQELDLLSVSDGRLKLGLGGEKENKAGSGGCR